MSERVLDPMATDRPTDRPKDRPTRQPASIRRGDTWHAVADLRVAGTANVFVTECDAKISGESTAITSQTHLADIALAPTCAECEVKEGASGPENAEDAGIPDNHAGKIVPPGDDDDGEAVENTSLRVFDRDNSDAWIECKYGDVVRLEDDVVTNGGDY